MGDEFKKYTIDDYWRGDKRFNVDALDAFNMSRAAKEYNGCIKTDDAIYNALFGQNEEERKIYIDEKYSLEKDRLMNNEELELYKKLMFTKYVQPYIDNGFLEYKGKREFFSNYLGSLGVQDCWKGTKKCWEAWRDILQGREERKYNAAVANAVKTAGVQATNGNGSPAKYCNPRCYTDDPGIPHDSQIELFVDLVLLIPLLLLRIGPVIIFWMLVFFFVHLKANRDAVRNEWEIEYRKTHGINKKGY